MKSVAVCVLSLVGFVALAQDNFPDVPESYMRDYHFQSKLHFYGLLKGDIAPRYGSSSDSPGATVKILALLPTAIDEYAKKLQQRIDGKSLSSNTEMLKAEFEFIHAGVALGLTDWIKRFGPEIRKHGSDPEKLVSRMRGLEPKLERAAQPLADVLTQRGEKLYFPEEHPLYKCLAHLKAVGAFYSPDSVYRGGRAPYRIHVARYVIEATTGLQGYVQYQSKACESNSRDGLPLYDADEMKSEFAYFDQNLRAAFAELKAEIEALGWSPESLAGELESANALQEALIAKFKPLTAQPFEDVKRHHWAKKAIEELHRAKVLVGYADGKFRG